MDKEMQKIRRKAVRLVEGGIEKVDGLFVKAVKSPTDTDCCEVCEMDSICHIDNKKDMVAVCTMCDIYGKDCYYLKLANKK